MGNERIVTSDDQSVYAIVRTNGTASISYRDGVHSANTQVDVRTGAISTMLDNNGATATFHTDPKLAREIYDAANGIAADNRVRLEEKSDLRQIAFGGPPTNSYLTR